LTACCFGSPSLPNAGKIVEEPFAELPLTEKEFDDDKEPSDLMLESHYSTTI
jgi:hypothetical protein